MRNPSVTLIILFLQINWFFFYTAFSMAKYTLKNIFAICVIIVNPKEISINFGKVLGFTFLTFFTKNRFGLNIIFFGNNTLNDSKVIVNLHSFELLFPCLNLVFSQDNINTLEGRQKLCLWFLQSEVIGVLKAQHWKNKTVCVNFSSSVKACSKTGVAVHHTNLFLIRSL